MADLSQGISDFFSDGSSFSADTRLYRLDTPLGQDMLLVERFVGKEALSALYEFHVDCLSRDVHIELKRLLAQQVTLRTRLADGSQGARTGYVAAVAQLGADGGFARYRLTVVPWLWLAQHRRTSRVFQDKSVLQIIEEVLAADAPRNHWRATPDAEAFLGHARIRSYCCQYRESDYAFLTRLLAEEGIGFYFEETDRQDGSAARLVLFADSTAFADDYSAAHANGGPGIRFHRDAAVEVQDTVQALGSERRLQPAMTTLAGWDYKAKRVVATSLPTNHEFGGAHAPHVESYDWAGVYPFATQAEADHYARILRDAADARFKSWFGRSSVRTFRPGTAFDLAESPFEQRDALGLGDTSGKRRFALTGVLHAGVNNLPAGFKHEVASRLGPAGCFAADERPESAAGLDHECTGDSLDTSAWEQMLADAETTGYTNRFTAIRADIAWRPALTDGTGLLLNPKPTAWGSQTAIVVGANGGTADAGTVHTDHLGRIRIRYPWQQGEQNTCWVRVAQMYAGPGYGAQFIPRIGQEVLVRFLDHDIDRPIVTGVLYNGQGQDDGQAYAAAGDQRAAGQDNKIGNGASPAWHGAAGEHRHAGFLSGFKSVALGADGYTRQSNELVFDDSSGRLRTKLATDVAATQLNLGHLIHQADNYRGGFRGSGWELRTDAYGAIRAGKGILISTYHGTAPGGHPEPAGENSPGIALLKQAKGFADTFNRAATLHQTVQFILVKGGALNGEQSQSRLDDEKAPIDALLRAISGLVNARDGGFDSDGHKVPHMHAPLVVVTAQAGLGVAAGDGLHMASGEVTHLASGRDMQIAVGEALTMHSGQAIGLLAGAVGAGEGNSGIKLYAGQGDIDLQAQSDTMTFAAKELVKMISANSHIDFAAAKSITLCTEAGASITIEGGNITFACPGTISIKASSKSFTGPTSASYALPVMPSSKPASVKFALSLQDIPGKHGVAPAGASWKIVELNSAATQPLSDGGVNPAVFNPDHWVETLHQGVMTADGSMLLSAEEQQDLFARTSLVPGRIWVISGLTAMPLQPAHWTTGSDQPNSARILDSLNFAGDGRWLESARHGFLEEVVKADARVSSVHQRKKEADA